VRAVWHGGGGAARRGEAPSANLPIEGPIGSPIWHCIPPHKNRVPPLEPENRSCGDEGVATARNSGFSG
jgi:hypothetical protein